MNFFLLIALVPLLPLLAAGITALLKQKQRGLSATLVIAAQTVSCAISVFGFAWEVGVAGSRFFPNRITPNFTWLTFGTAKLQLGLLLDPLSAGMAAMVSFVTLLIFIYSVGYMKSDRNFTRFFTFLSLFSGAMLGVVLSNSLLLTFICWELVGLASYLLIGFWFHKPEAAAAAKKAFLTTRVGDMGFLIGMLWLYHASGTLLFYDNGHGCLEQSALATMAKTMVGGMALSNVIALLIFCGAAGKSGQFPLHVWLPDAMEGPTPVSALIHAATMVAAGVYLVARVFPIFTATGAGLHSSSLLVVAFIGAFTALFEPGFVLIALTSTVIVACGLGLGWLVYGRRALSATELDPLQTACAPLFKALANRLYVDEIYNATLVRGLAFLGGISAWVDRRILAGAVNSAAGLSVLLSCLSDRIDRFLLNFGFDSSCNALREYGGGIAECERGRVQGYLRVIGVGMVVLLAIIGWLLV